MNKFIQTNKFTTIGDDGLYYDVIEYAEFKPFKSTFNFPGGDALGIRQYELSDGSVVEKIGPNEFMVLLTDVKLTLVH